MEEKEDKHGKDKLEEFIYWNTFGVEKWYHQLIGATEEEGHRPCTFRSSFLAISIEEAQAFVEYQELLLEHLDDEVPPPIEHPLLVKVQARLEELIQPFVHSSGGAFVKMSDRSPKDSVTERGRIQRFMAQPMKEVEGKPLRNNQWGLPAVYRAFCHALRVMSGSEALLLLLVSFRTLEDVQMRLGFKEYLWDLNIIIREWTDFDVALEFRGFVCDGSLNALSQYYYDCFFPQLQEHADKIQRSILQFWEEIKHKISYQSYVVDFAILPCDLADSSLEFYPVVVIELNPFDASTDGALFHWVMDKNVLHSGPFTYRVVQEAGKPERRKTWWTKEIHKYLHE